MTADAAAATLDISGATRVFALLGDPIAQVRAPALLNPMLARRGTDAVLIPVQVTPADLVQVAHALQQVPNLHGMLVTVPHKVAALALADRVSDRARLAASVNALRRDPDGAWSADTFDGDGFVRGLDEAGHHPRGRRVCVVGAGGAGSAIAVALLDAGVAQLHLVDANPGTLDTLAARLSDGYPGRVHAAAHPPFADADIVVNATPLGLRAGDPLPFRVAELAPHAVVADIIMTPADTALLRAARRRGLRAHPGEPMLVHQLDSYLDFFRL